MRTLSELLETRLRSRIGLFGELMKYMIGNEVKEKFREFWLPCWVRLKDELLGQDAMTERLILQIHQKYAAENLRDEQLFSTDEVRRRIVPFILAQRESKMHYVYVLILIYDALEPQQQQSIFNALDTFLNAPQNVYDERIFDILLDQWARPQRERLIFVYLLKVQTCWSRCQDKKRVLLKMISVIFELERQHLEEPGADEPTSLTVLEEAEYRRSTSFRRFDNRLTLAQLLMKVLVCLLSGSTMLWTYNIIDKHFRFSSKIQVILEVYSNFKQEDAEERQSRQLQQDP